MNCLEFQRLSLSDPHCADFSFIKHSDNCPGCLRYVKDLRQMDDSLSASLDIEMPQDFVARLKLTQEMADDGKFDDDADDVHGVKRSNRLKQNYGIAASFIGAVLIAGFLLSNYVNLEKKIAKDYETLLAGVVAHMHENPFEPVWESDRANRTINTLLSSYGDGGMKMHELPNLQFTRLCPLGQYRGLHATLQTDGGLTTFAFIKGDSVSDVLDTAYEGYVTRVKPIRDGSLVIISRNKKSLEQADSQLNDAIYWEI